MHPRGREITSLFIEASILAGESRELYLRRLQQRSPMVASELRELLEIDLETTPDLSRACWEPTPLQPAAPARRFADSFVLEGRFEIRQFLGSGGLGEVYGAYDRRQQIAVALKTLRHDVVPNAQVLAQLRNELNTARAISHRNVCRLYDVHWPSDPISPPYVSMEWIVGETLANFLHSSGPLSESKAQPVVFQILDGLEAAHSMGIVHRDIKTSNIMLTGEEARVVITDFGLARLAPMDGLNESSSHSQSLAGTPAYMSPEQFCGKQATFASDIYALGVVLYEIVTGRKPFSGSTAVEVASLALHAKPASPRSLAPSLSHGWELAILACLERQPSRRPASISALRKMLSEVPPHPLSRRSFWVSGSVLGAMGLGSLWFYRPAPNYAYSLVVSDLENPTRSAGLNYLCRSIPSELARLLSSVNRIPVVQTREPLGGAGQSLSPRFHLEGSLTGHSELSIHLRLKDRSNGTVLWEKTAPYPESQNRSELHESLSREVLTQLDRFRANGETSPPAQASVPTANGAALDKYMRARYLLEESSPSSTQAATSLLEAAVVEDPNFALAWSALADTHLLHTVFTTGDANNHLLEALRCAGMAVRLDPLLPEAHASSAAVHQHSMAWVPADASYREALRLKPNFPRAHRWYAGFLVQFGRFDEALRHSDLALQQDPYDKMGPAAIGLYRIFAGQPQSAIELLAPAVEGKDVEGLRHNLGQAYVRLAQLSPQPRRQQYLQQAMEQASIIVAIEKRKSSPRPLLSDRLLSLVHAVSGNIPLLAPVQARLLEDVSAGRLSPGDAAWSYAILHNDAVALDLLESAYRSSPRSLLYMKVNPFLENLKGHARFERILRDLKL